MGQEIALTAAAVIPATEAAVIGDRLDQAMTDLASTLPADLAYPAWLEHGRNLATSKRQMDWLIGDWIAFGREHFPEQVEMALGDIADDPRNIRLIERTAKAFPPHLRASGLSFEHHAHLADMPTQEALPLLAQAEREKLPARKLRIAAIDRKVELGMILPREDDPEDDALLACVRAWNRAPRSVREEFAEMVSESSYGVIEP